jgi:hypothetical protein
LTPDGLSTVKEQTLRALPEEEYSRTLARACQRPPWFIYFGPGGETLPLTLEARQGASGR